ncbi:MAG: hypothetical protein Q8P81_02510 [Nanoarchaeota archaeon]|nr:hypothetical protein [Nanoarchaeota archaeon]
MFQGKNGVSSGIKIVLTVLVFVAALFGVIPLGEAVDEKFGFNWTILFSLISMVLLSSILIKIWHTEEKALSRKDHFKALAAVIVVGIGAIYLAFALIIGPLMAGLFGDPSSSSDYFKFGLLSAVIVIMGWIVLNRYLKSDKPKDSLKK